MFTFQNFEALDKTYYMMFSKSKFFSWNIIQT